jgi:hypothetical protein
VSADRCEGRRSRGGRESATSKPLGDFRGSIASDGDRRLHSGGRRLFGHERSANGFVAASDRPLNRLPRRDGSRSPRRHRSHGRRYGERVHGSGHLVHLSGHLVRRSADLSAVPGFPRRRTPWLGIGGPLPPESLDTFVRNGVSKSRYEPVPNPIGEGRDSTPNFSRKSPRFPLLPISFRRGAAGGRRKGICHKTSIMWLGFGARSREFFPPKPASRLGSVTVGVPKGAAGPIAYGAKHSNRSPNIAFAHANRRIATKRSPSGGSA